MCFSCTTGDIPRVASLPVVKRSESVSKFFAFELFARRDSAGERDLDDRDDELDEECSRCRFVRGSSVC